VRVMLVELTSCLPTMEEALAWCGSAEEIFAFDVRRQKFRFTRRSSAAECGGAAVALTNVIEDYEGASAMLATIPAWCCRQCSQRWGRRREGSRPLVKVDAHTTALPF